MKIKFLTLLMAIVFVPFMGNSQENSCADGFLFKTYREWNPQINIQDVVIDWDFSQVNNVQDLTLVIEVQGLDNCWEELNGVNRFALIKNSVENLSQNLKGTIRVEHLGINSKCFKWRAVIVNSAQSCEKVTEWEFKNFL
jgi:hypothetical protein